MFSIDDVLSSVFQKKLLSVTQLPDMRGKSCFYFTVLLTEFQQRLIMDACLFI